ncbi:YibE/F family protein [Nocardioides sp. SYSU DS0651]|uniref:YibE/F family protein n=1 Tax=Nocardioides sp. SYSU DS0651 TaxID=3415955 RepID=UPI003F4AF8E4
MGHGHSHRAAGGADDIRIGSTARVALLAGLGLALVATVVGLVLWWPSSDAVSERAEAGGAAARFAAPGVTFPVGEVLAVAEPCVGEESPDATGCGRLEVAVDDRTVAVDVPPEVLDSGIAPGDRVELLKSPPTEGADGADGADGAGDAGPQYSYFAIDRDRTLGWLTVLFVLVVLAIARWRGLFALTGLVFGGVVVWWWLLPTLLDGAPGVGVAITGASAIMFVVLYTTHGFSLRTSTALAGTLIGVMLTAGIGTLAVSRTRLTGISDESGAVLSTFGALDFQSLLGCALVIAGLGVLNDVTITQASAVWELRAGSPEASRGQVFASAMRIGRDHIASAIYTIVFAYVGTAVTLLMVLRVYDRPLIELLSTEQLAEEVVRTLATSIGLVLAVPITTGLAALVAAPARATDAAATDAAAAEAGPATA